MYIIGVGIGIIYSGKLEVIVINRNSFVGFLKIVVLFVIRF